VAVESRIFKPAALGASIRKASVGGAVMLSIAAGVLAAPTAAHAAPEVAPGDVAPLSVCVGTVLGQFRAVESGASFNHNGRRIELQNERVFDTYSRAEIKSGRQSGDQVWIDRSNRQFSLSTSGIVSDATAESQGWQQCGPFSSRTSEPVQNNIFAARACARVDGVSKCGKWYVD
jgi:hypothetical protein